MIKLGCVGSSTVQGIARFQRINEIVLIEIRFHLFIVSQLPIDGALPHLYHVVTLRLQVLGFLYGGLMKIVHGIAHNRIQSIARVTVDAA